MLEHIGTTTSNDLAPPGDYQPGTFLNNGTGKSNILNHNAIIVKSGTLDYIFGAYYVASGVNNNDYTAKKNSITIEDVTAGENIYGAYVRANSSPDYVTALVEENTITIFDGTLNGSYIYGGYVNTTSTNNSAQSTAKNNRVTIDTTGGVSVRQAATIRGGEAQATSNSDNSDHTSRAKATDNHLTIINSGSNPLGGSGYITGGRAQASGRSGAATLAEALNNSVTVENVTAYLIQGGVASVDGIGATAIASYNTLNINGGTFNHVMGGSASIDGSGTPIATYNTVNISGDPTFLDNALRGGFTGDGQGTKTNIDDFTGNTLNLSSQIEAPGVTNFEFLNFVLPADMQPGDAMLTVNNEEATWFPVGGAVLGKEDGTPSKITVSTLGGTTPLQAGDQRTLIDAIDTDAADIKATVKGYVESTGTGKHGATLGYNFVDIGISPDEKQLRATVQSVELRPESKILSEGFLAGSILLNQTGDMIAQRTEQARCGAFFDISFGDSRYNTGSHIDMKGFSLLTGITRCVNTSRGKMTYGAFFEYGNGNDTGLYVTGARGNSDVYHYGGGLLGRLNLRNSVYVEGSFRAGGMDNGFTSNLLDGQGNAAGYDSSSAYIGTHLGLGRKLKLSSRNTLDLYSKYFWTHQNGDRVTLSTNDPVRFESIDSHRLRLGGRSTSAVNRRVSTYWGAAWEHEFAGTARATTYGYAIDSPSLRGSTGIGELGVSVKSQRALPLAFDFGVQGYIGKREGVAGSVQVRWAW